MAQHDYVIANGTGAAVRSDINNGLAAIVSNNSGTSEPATMYAYQWWADTTTGLLKIRNAANNAWVTVGTLADANLGLLTSGSTIVAPLGDASTPGITFTGDLNTGIFSPTADQLAISTSGTERVEFGTSEVVFNDGGANYDFRIEGDTNSSLFFVDASAEAVGIGSNAPRSLLSFGAADTTGTNGINLYDNTGNYRSGIGGASTYLRFYAPSSGAAIQFGRLSISDGSTFLESGRFDDSGRLLVGTSTSREGFYTSTNPHLVQVETTGYTAQSWVANNSTNSETGCYLTAARSRGGIGSFTILNSGDSIGHLSFAGADGTRFVEAARIEARVDGTPGNNDMPGRLVFSTTADGASSPTERMRIDSNGFVNVGAYTIPSSTPGMQLYGAGNLIFCKRSDTGEVISFFANSTTKVGNIVANASSTTYNTSSDYRLKENVVPLTGAIDRLQQIPVHRFNFIADPDKTVDGFLAHEAQSVVPECVTGTKDEVDDDGNPVYQGIDQSKLVPLLTAALQEALQKIDDLEGRLTAAGL
jgi:hypothetical protein